MLLDLCKRQIYLCSQGLIAMSSELEYLSCLPIVCDEVSFSLRPHLQYCYSIRESVEQTHCISKCLFVEKQNNNSLHSVPRG